jgi:hypothetical protein
MIGYQSCNTWRKSLASLWSIHGIFNNRTLSSNLSWKPRGIWSRGLKPSWCILRYFCLTRFPQEGQSTSTSRLWKKEKIKEMVNYRFVQLVILNGILFFVYLFVKNIYRKTRKKFHSKLEYGSREFIRVKNSHFLWDLKTRKLSIFLSLAKYNKQFTAY